MEVEEFKAAFKRDAIGTIKLFLNNLVQLQEQGKLTGEDLIPTRAVWRAGARSCQPSRP